MAGSVLRPTHTHSGSGYGKTALSLSQSVVILQGLIRKGSFPRAVKEYDDTQPTDPPTNAQLDAALAVVHELLDGLSERIEQLSVRIANLETQRTPQDNNEDDMEWY